MSEKVTGQLQEALCAPEYNLMRKASYVALDFPSWDAAAPLVEAFGDAVDGYKVGLELFHADGMRTLEQLRLKNKRVFLDMKLHDIPNTVKGALRAICEYSIEMVNVHAAGGSRMMESAREAVHASAHPPLLIAVTILTSLDEADLQDVGYTSSARELVVKHAVLAKRCGLDGVVASAQEIQMIREATENSRFEIVVPGTRPAGASRHDQARTMTPSEAMGAGATRLVLGRAVTESPNPLQSLHAIWDEMKNGNTVR